ncbi:MAG: histidinol dehydrogenase [Muribaculum sp.]|nr:histidinol dehydrogenase [Muribaculum sp.]
MDIIKYPERTEWRALTERALASEAEEVSRRVSEIMDSVRDRGDEAVKEFERRFTGADLEVLKVSDKEIEEASRLIPPELCEAISQAAGNIEKFHRAQSMKEPVMVETIPGIECRQSAVAIDRVGLYIPGGNSPLFSTVLMLAIPAKIAGCMETVLCTPARADGTVHPAILYAADLAGVDKIYKTGGAQAIAAMAYGTESIPKVDKIFGPGNRYVMEAKQQAARRSTAIDMPAGPSEVLVIADENADPEFVAADFLSQAEHGPDSQSILLTTSNELAEKLPEVIDRLLGKLPRREMMGKSLSHSRIIVLRDDREMMDFSNMYAPEHLIINHKNAENLCTDVRNSGSVFIGEWSPESVGDYASGTNHTLPTSGYARAFSGVNLDSFTKKITFQKLSREGVLGIGRTVEVMAENEDLMAHKLAVSLRLNKIQEL